VKTHNPTRFLQTMLFDTAIAGVRGGARQRLTRARE
jgi:hypothetical protein